MHFSELSSDPQSPPPISQERHRLQMHVTTHGFIFVLEMPTQNLMCSQHVLLPISSALVLLIIRNTLIKAS